MQLHVPVILAAEWFLFHATCSISRVGTGSQVGFLRENTGFWTLGMALPVPVTLGGNGFRLAYLDQYGGCGRGKRGMERRATAARTDSASRGYRDFFGYG